MSFKCLCLRIKIHRFLIAYRKLSGVGSTPKGQVKGMNNSGVVGMSLIINNECIFKFTGIFDS